MVATVRGRRPSNLEPKELIVGGKHDHINTGAGRKGGEEHHQGRQQSAALDEIGDMDAGGLFAHLGMDGIEFLLIVQGQADQRGHQTHHAAHNHGQGVILTGAAGRHDAHARE